MTKAEVQNAIKAIRDNRNDPEVAGELENELHHNVLEAIAKDATDDPKGLARTALTSRKVKFPRGW